jgi:hypothetical protein
MRSVDTGAPPFKPAFKVSALADWQRFVTCPFDTPYVGQNYVLSQIAHRLRTVKSADTAAKSLSSHASFGCTKLFPDDQH